MPGRESSGLPSVVVRHLAEIGAGRCSITDEDLELETDEGVREVLVGLVTLHEDLAYERHMRLASEAQRQELIAQLQAAISARDEFLSVASHELRTPLSTLSLQAAVNERWLDHNDLGAHASVLRERGAVIGRQVKRLARLVDELLDVSRITTGHLALDRKPVDLRVVVETVLDRLDIERGKGTVAIVRDQLQSVVGEWDTFRLDQVVTNLVSNALRYGEGKPVVVRTEAADGGARLVVEDSGIGIAPEDHARVFEQFGRAVSSRNFGGLGLGLWIVRRIVELHGGRVEVQSELGRGATFAVWLPASGAAT